MPTTNAGRAVTIANTSFPRRPLITPGMGGVLKRFKLIRPMSPGDSLSRDTTVNSPSISELATVKEPEKADAVKPMSTADAPSPLIPSGGKEELSSKKSSVEAGVDSSVDFTPVPVSSTVAKILKKRKKPSPFSRIDHPLADFEEFGEPGRKKARQSTKKTTVDSAKKRRVKKPLKVAII